VNPQNIPESSSAVSSSHSDPLAIVQTSPALDPYSKLASIVLGAEPLGVVLRRIAELSVETVPGVEDGSITLIERGKPKTVAFHGHLASALDERQYEAGSGPCLDAAVSGQVIVLDTATASSYPEFTRQAQRHGIRHVLSIGMPTLQETSGAVNLYATSAVTPFEPETLESLTVFAGYAAVTLFNAAMYAGALDEVAQMKQALASRAGIEQAKGIIMGQQGCTAEEAFAMLLVTSSTSNRKLRDVAQMIVDQAVSG
jgi:GAF domain-containing protein